MRKQIDKGLRRLGYVGVCAACVLVAGAFSGCVDGKKLSAQQKQISEQTEQIHDRAYRCTPRELALAEAHQEFGRHELSYGNGKRAEDHIVWADENLKLADENSLHPLCQDPKTQDRDKDGIIDMEDKCPDTPGKPEFAGCPDPDIDKDGVCDKWVSEMGLTSEFLCKGIDLCPTEPGELAYSGCSNPDTDGDEICNSWVEEAGLAEKFIKTCHATDLCPDVRGTDAFFGCPNPDSDGDKVCDPWVNEKGLLAKFSDVCQSVDKCPFEKGVIEENGCPPPHKLIVVSENEIQLNEQFQFKTGKATLLPASNELLDEIAQVLKDNPTIEISIEGHTDSKGKPKSNQKLSENRAKSVLDALAKRGIDKKRMHSKGFGQNVPIATNDTEEGRALNRRVEIHITKR